MHWCSLMAKATVSKTVDVGSTPATSATRDGREVIILEGNKRGMSIFTIYGLLEGKPCHWTAEGMYRMDGVPDGKDLVDGEA